MSLPASRIEGCQSFGGFTTCFPSVTNHSNLGQPAETVSWNQFKTEETMQTESQNKDKTECTFKRGYLPRLCFRQAFLTSVSGQCQCDATAAQQKANLLTSCILGNQRGWQTEDHTLRNFGKSTINKNKISITALRKDALRECENCNRERKKDNDWRRKPYSILHQGNSR